MEMNEVGYLVSWKKMECCGCEACVNICPKDAIRMIEDSYGFRYPLIEQNKCIHCDLCKKVCPIANRPSMNTLMEAYGGYINDNEVRIRSTSGGMFTAIEKGFFKKNTNSGYKNRKVYGAVATGMSVKHESAENLDDCMKFCSSKYVQSQIKEVYRIIECDLKNGNEVLFSGTPCQVAGLRNYLDIRKMEIDNLILVEVLCAGVAAPLLFKKYDDYLRKKKHSRIKDFYWRYKDNNRWDYNCCHYVLKNGKRKTIDRWFSGYWSIFTQRLMMRPSCETCPFKGIDRVSDITLGDMWGVDKEYPELYDDNRGTSLVLCNSERGLEVIDKASSFMTKKQVDFSKLEKYQIPSIRGKSFHPDYDSFMCDLEAMSYVQLCKKWVIKPSAKLLYGKYIWNNKARVRCWKMRKNIMQFFKSITNSGGKNDN